MRHVILGIVLLVGFGVPTLAQQEFSLPAVVTIDANQAFSKPTNLLPAPAKTIRIIDVTSAGVVEPSKTPIAGHVDTYLLPSSTATNNALYLASAKEGLQTLATVPLVVMCARPPKVDGTITVYVIVKVVSADVPPTK